jgi:hypothetical protein
MSGPYAHPGGLLVGERKASLLAGIASATCPRTS